MSIPQFNPDLIRNPLDLTDTFKKDLNFFLQDLFSIFPPQTNISKANQ